MIVLHLYSGPAAAIFAWSLCVHSLLRGIIGSCAAAVHAGYLTYYLWWPEHMPQHREQSSRYKDSLNQHQQSNKDEHACSLECRCMEEL